VFPYIHRKILSPYIDVFMPGQVSLKRRWGNESLKLQNKVIGEHKYKFGLNSERDTCRSTIRLSSVNHVYDHVKHYFILYILFIRVKFKIGVKM
jgi:hypothetical protein